MLVKGYFAICGILALAALLSLATGTFTSMAAVVFGFIGFGVVFMGMIAVLPIAVTHPAAAKVEQPKVVAVPVEAATPVRAFHNLKSA